MNIGLKIKQHREEAGYSQTELAALSGLSLSYIYKLETAHYTSPSLMTIKAIAMALNLPIHILLDELLKEENST